MQQATLTAPAAELGRPWRNRFAGLGPAFHTRLSPLALRDPYWVGKKRD